MFMFSTIKAKIFGVVGLATLLAMVGMFAWGMNWKAKATKYNGMLDVILVATQHASDNPELKRKDISEQVSALGDSNRHLKAAITTQNKRIDEMAADAVRLKAEAEELQRIADKAKAQRRVALESLADMTITPGRRDDCELLLKEAENALDLVYQTALGNEL
jgi:hypothetical protein